MRPPANAVIGHLVWARNGQTWAVWRVHSTPYLWLPQRRKMSEHARVRSALAALPTGEAMVLSVASRIDPAEVVDAMVDRIDLAQHQGWADMVEAALDRLELVELYERRAYLCVQLPDRGNRWRALWRAASAPMLSGFGLAATPIARGELVSAARQADDLATRLRSLRLEPATAGEIRWLYARSLRRGLISEPPRMGWPEPRLRRITRAATPAVASPSLASLVDGVFHEGGAPDDEDRPWHRRYLRIDSAGGVSYQALAAVADAPQQFGFPGGVSEWLYVADQMPFPVDWACRIRVVPNQDASRGAARQQRELAGQAAEYDAEPAGPPPSLAAAMDAVDDERAQLAAAPSEPELQTTMVYAVAADRLDDLEQRVGLLQAAYKAAEWDMPVPTGGQRELFEAMLPGAPTTRVCGDYRQYMLPRDLAAGMPFAGAALGDERGMLLGASRDAGCARPVLIDPAAGPAQDRDGSIAVFGALGTGKSYLAKRLATTVLLRGGQMLLVDRTEAGEYVRFAHAMSEAGLSVQVATIGDQDGLLLDPLVVFRDDPDTATQTAVGYLGMLCGVEPTSLEAAHLSRAARKIATRGGRLGDILTELQAVTSPEATEARQLGLRLEALSQNRFAAAAFGTGQHSVDTNADCVVIHLPHLAVPSRETMLSEHLARRLLPEQVASLGLLYLVTAMAQRVAYRHPDRFAALCLDEAWALTFTMPGQQLLSDGIRDGRKHNAAVWIFSQHPDDLPTGLRDLVSTRYVFGLSGGAGETALRWLGVDVSEENLELLEEWTNRPEHGPGEPSECLLRDPSGRIGRLEIAQAETEMLRHGFESNPTRITAPADAGLSPPEALPQGDMSPRRDSEAR